MYNKYKLKLCQFSVVQGCLYDVTIAEIKYMFPGCPFLLV